MVVRLLGVVLAGCAAILTSTGPAAGRPLPGPSGGFHTFTAGGDLHGTAPVADVSSGFDVWVDPAAAHVDRITPAIRYAVGQLTRYGIDIRYRGVASGGAAPSGSGVITVTEAAGAGGAGCGHRPGADSGGVKEGIAYPAFQDVGVATRINGGTITFCPSLWSSGPDYVVAIALHEMGHAVGLGHYRDAFRGRPQVMNPIVPDLQSYQDGDVNGLRYIAAQTAALRTQSVLAGAVESWDVTRAGLAVTGWAVVGRTSQFADITVTRDNTSVYRITTNTARPDVVRRTGTRWPSPGFSGSQVPMSDGPHRYCVVASASDSGALTLGCRSLDYPPAAPTPEPSRLPALGKAPIEVWWSSTATEAALGGAAALLLLVVAVVAVRRRRR